MGLRERFAAYAVSSAHVLVVEVPGWWTARAAVERELAARGWRTALSPADADVLILCGEPGDRLATAVDRVWDQFPGPRARVAVRTTDAAAVALADAAALLLDEGHQRADAQARPAAPSNHEQSRGEHHGSMDHGMDRGSMDHGSMDMAPAGIPLANGGADRDGLVMDVLHLPLGPVLPYWPAGLVLHCSLQGDVVAEARAEVLEPAVGSPPCPSEWAATGRAAQRCDGVARLLAVAGWDDAAAAARRTRDALLAGLEPEQGAQQLDRLQRRITGSRSLRWLLRGLGPIDDAVLAEHGLSQRARGDVHDRLVAMLESARASLLGRDLGEPADATAVLAALPGLVTGLELGAARLVVASVDLHPTGTRWEPARA